MEFKFCPFCGKPQAQVFAFCPFCGENIGKIIEKYNSVLGEDCSDTEPCSADGSVCAVLENEKPRTQADLYIENEIVAAIDYDKKLTRARTMCITGSFDTAYELYTELCEQFPEKPHGYIGLVRVASKNYTVLNNDEISRLLSVVAAICPGGKVPGSDEEFTDYLFRRELRDCTVEDGVLVKYSGDAERLYIPDGYVTSIKSDAFKGNKTLASLSIPDSVREVGERAFYECKSLKEAYIGAAEIGREAFYCCKNLSKLILGDGVKIIRNRAFAFVGLEQDASCIFIPESVTSVGSRAFECIRAHIYCAAAKERTAFWGEERYGQRDWCDWPQNVRYGAKRDDANQ